MQEGMCTIWMRELTKISEEEAALVRKAETGGVDVCCGMVVKV